MSEFTVGGNTYRSSKMSAMVQFHVLRRMAPVVGPLQSLANLADTPGTEGMHPGVFQAFAEAIGSLSDESTNYILDQVLRTVERKQAENTWAKIKPDGVMQLMFADIDMLAMLQITTHVIRDNYSELFQKGLAS